MVFLTSVFRGIGSHSRIISTIESQAILANKGEGGRGGITKERKGKGEGNKVKKKRGGGRGATERGVAGRGERGERGVHHIVQPTQHVGS